MELSDEQKARILDEERQRIAEEKYREEVRRQLSAPRDVILPVTSVANRKPQTPNPNLPFPTGKFKQRSETWNALFGNPPCAPHLLRNSQPRRSQTGLTRANPSVVIVENYDEDGRKAGHGSGYVYATDGVVLTNYHVIRGAHSLSIKIPSKGSV